MIIREGNSHVFRQGKHKSYEFSIISFMSILKIIYTKLFFPQTKDLHMIVCTFRYYPSDLYFFNTSFLRSKYFVVVLRVRILRLLRLLYILQKLKAASIAIGLGESIYELRCHLKWNLMLILK